MTEPLNEFFREVCAYLPHLLGAILLFVVAWTLATVLRFVVRKAFGLAG